MAESLADIRCLSVRAPWWWFILHAGKDIENRDWPTRHRGTVLIHASKWWSLRAVSEDAEAAAVAVDRRFAGAEISFRQMRDMGGCIVGQVDIVDCVTRSESPWFFGEYGFVLERPGAFKTPIPCKGKLGLFSPPPECWAAIRAQMPPERVERREAEQ